MLQVQNTGWGSSFPKHCKASSLTSPYTLTVQLSSQTINMVIAHNWAQLRDWVVQMLSINKNTPVSQSPPLLGQCFICSMYFKKATHLMSLELLFSLCMEWCVAAALAQKTIQKYITLLLMQYVYHPKRQTVAPISNSVIFYFLIINFCQHQANKCMIPS